MICPRKDWFVCFVLFLIPFIDLSWLSCLRQPNLKMRKFGMSLFDVLCRIGFEELLARLTSMRYFLLFLEKMKLFDLTLLCITLFTCVE